VRRHGAAIIAIVAASVLLIDQVAKLQVRAHLSPPGTSIPLLGDLLRLTFTRNDGAAFGMFPGGRALFVAVHIVVLVCIVGYAVRRRPTRPWLIASLGLVAGGALGNLVDRVVFGWVTDFLQIPFGFPVFNVADSAVVVGVAMLVWWLLFGPAPGQPSVGCEPAADTGEESGS
jgi:signal peptidase II